MKQINWVLQKNLIDNKTLDELRKAILIDDAKFQEVDVVPFSEDLPFTLNKDESNVLYGTTSLVMNASRNEDYKKAVFYNDDQFQMKVYMNVYMNVWNTRMLNFEGSIVAIGDFLDEHHQDGEECFIRPNEDTKSFTGLVTTFSGFKEMTDNALGLNPYFQKDSLILVAKPKAIEKEWRNFIVDGKVVSSSRYAVDRKRSINSNDTPRDMIRFTEECCCLYMPNNVFVMDVALYDGQYYIVECNCFNDTGFYDHDILEVVKGVNEHIRKC